MVKVQNFTVVNFQDAVPDGRGKRVRRQIILLYALGEDGIVYEMSGGKWLPMPIEEPHIRTLTPTRNNNGIG